MYVRRCVLELLRFTRLERRWPARVCRAYEQLGGHASRVMGRTRRKRVWVVRNWMAGRRHMLAWLGDR
jgi:hypothetical protein